MLDSSDLTDRTLGDFRVLRKLGRGATAEVYLAEQISEKRYVALKVLRSDLPSVQREKLLKRFHLEARAAHSLVHPNIVQMYSSGEAEGLDYIAQEYVQGRNLQTYIQEQGTPSLPQCLHIMVNVANALQAAGEAGIVHRDIKPDNILLTHTGEVKVADFGLAHLSELSSEEVNLTQVGTTLGTPMYMSPEQVRGEKLDHRSDLYSFGVTCYHLLAGRPPFTGSTAMAVAIKHINEQPKDLAKRRPDLPPALCEVVAKLMAKDSNERYLTARQMLRDLKRVVESLKKQNTKTESSGSPGKSSSTRTGGKSDQADQEPLELLDSTERPVSVGATQQVDSNSGQAPDDSWEELETKWEDTEVKPTDGTPAAIAHEAVPTRPDWMQPLRRRRRERRTVQVTEDGEVEEVVEVRPITEADDENAFALRKADTDFEEMDLTPMVDVTFLLLIFFMITASFSIQKTIQVPPPDPEKKGAAQMVESLEDLEAEAIIVEIDEENGIKVDDVAADLDELADIFADKMVSEQKNELVLEAADKALHDTVIQVVDAANDVNIERIRMVTRTEGD